MKIILLLFCFSAVLTSVILTRLVVEATTYYTPLSRKEERGIFMPRKF